MSPLNQHRGAFTPAIVDKASIHFDDHLACVRVSHQRALSIGHVSENKRRPLSYASLGYEQNLQIHS